MTAIRTAQTRIRRATQSTSWQKLFSWREVLSPFALSVTKRRKVARVMGSWGTLVIVVQEAILKKLPGWLARMVYSEERLMSELELDLRSTHALSFSLGHSPNAWCYLRLTNKSPFPAKISTVEVDVWDQQPLCSLEHQAHEPISAKDTKEIHCADFLNEWQERRVHEARAQSKSFSMSARVVVETIYGVRELRFHHKEGVRADISGTPVSAVAVS